MIGNNIVTIPSYVVKIEEETNVHLTPESHFNEMLSEPESNLGSPETENIEIQTNEQSENEEKPIKQDAQKEPTK